MKLYHQLIQIGVVSGITLFAAACGGGGNSDDDTPANVVDLFTDDPAVAVGDDVDLDVLFSFANQIVVDDDHHVTIAVKIPNGLGYEPDTSRIDETGGTDSVTPAVEVCSNGDTFLRYDLAKNVLENATNPGGDGDGRLKLALAGTAPVGEITIEAAAGYDFEVVDDSCLTGITPQRTTGIVVTH